MDLDQLVVSGLGTTGTLLSVRIIGCQLIRMDCLCSSVDILPEERKKPETRQQGQETRQNKRNETKVAMTFANERKGAYSSTRSDSALTLLMLMQFSSDSSDVDATVAIW